MDYFALGGIILAEDDIDALIAMYKAFMERWELNYPLHSTKIRGARGPFGWLRSHPEKAERFLADLENYLLSLPVIGMACVIDRPGYVARYAEKYGGQPWLMCKTAYAILVERSAKYAQRHGGQLEVFFEQAGKAEDTDIKNYTRLMKRDGMPFDKGTSANYGGLTAEDLRGIILGEPRERTKKTPMMQVADLYLYPMVKGGYDPSYGPYRALMNARRIIDAQLTAEELGSLGVKYSCFDGDRKSVV